MAEIILFLKINKNLELLTLLIKKNNNMLKNFYDGSGNIKLY
jgi:hypothetical protein